MTLVRVHAAALTAAVQCAAWAHGVQGADLPKEPAAAPVVARHDQHGASRDRRLVPFVFDGLVFPGPRPTETLCAAPAARESFPCSQGPSRPGYESVSDSSAKPGVGRRTRSWALCHGGRHDVLSAGRS